MPAADLDSGKAVRVDGRTVGDCCLPGLRGALSVPAVAAASSLPAAPTAPSPQPEGGKLLTMGVVLLAAVAAAVIFLDNRISAVSAEWRKDSEKAAENRLADSDVLMRMDRKIEQAVTRADLEPLQSRAGEFAASLEVLRGSLQEWRDGTQRDLTAVRQDLRALSDRTVDYRPLLADLRERQGRASELLEALRTMTREPEPAPASAPAPGEVVPADADGSPLSPQLQELAGKLSAADPAVRFEAVDMLVETKNPVVLPFVLPLTADPDLFVRRLTVEGLREFRTVEVVDALLKVMREDADLDVRDTAWRSLRDVTGEKFAYDAKAAKEVRARALQRWQEWWDKERATFGK